MIAHLSGADYNHTSLTLMTLISGVTAVYWARVMGQDMRLQVPRLVPATALLMALALWVTAIFLWMRLTEPHIANGGIWLRPAFGLYMLTTVYRSSLFRPLMKRIQRTAICLNSK